MRGIRRTTGWIVVLMAVALMMLVGFAALRGRAQDLPWTPLDLGRPVGMFTGRKLAALTQDFAQCRAAMDRAGIAYTVLAPVRREGRCGYADGVRLGAGGARTVALSPRDVGMACPVAAALSVWEWTSVQPAAQAVFGRRVTGIEHFGSYNCRRMYDRDAGNWSEHATADALDIAAFRLSDGTRISVVGDWRGGGPKAAFLRQVRDGACGLFATTLSPDYNAAHRDHFHLDQANRGAMGWRACR